jgi:hypothetical protein
MSHQPLASTFRKVKPLPEIKVRNQFNSENRREAEKTVS